MAALCTTDDRKNIDGGEETPKGKEAWVCAFPRPYIESLPQVWYITFEIAVWMKSNENGAFEF